MKNKYHDTSGIRVPSDRINEALHNLNITEDELIEFLGKERIEADGYANSLLDIMESHDKFYLGD